MREPFWPILISLMGCWVDATEFLKMLDFIDNFRLKKKNQPMNFDE